MSIPIPSAHNIIAVSAAIFINKKSPVTNRERRRADTEKRARIHRIQTCQLECDDDGRRGPSRPAWASPRPAPHDGRTDLLTDRPTNQVGGRAGRNVTRLTIKIYRAGTGRSHDHTAVPSCPMLTVPGTRAERASDGLPPGRLCVCLSVCPCLIPSSVECGGDCCQPQCHDDCM